MKYLMLVYGEVEDMNSETLTTKIAEELQPIAMSDQIKYIYGDGNAIFHFDSELKFAEMSIYCDILIEEFSEIMYVLLPFNGMMTSNAGDNRIDHLLSLGNNKQEPNKVDIEFIDHNDSAVFEMFVNMVKPTLQEINEKEITCEMSLDELLDKMIDQGVESLTDVEKQKLEEYSK